MNRSLPRNLKLILPLLLLFVANIGHADEDDVIALAHAIDLRYNHLHSLRADFTEIYAGAGSERTESGILWLKKPGKMRWEYRSPKEKLFLTDGKQAWFFITGEKQARRMSMKEMDDLRIPLAFLLGKSQLQRDLKGLKRAHDLQPAAEGNVLLRGMLRGTETRLTGLILELTPEHQIYRVLLEGVDGSTTEYRFDNQKENVETLDQQFRFIPPPGVEIMEDGFPH